MLQPLKQRKGSKNSLGGIARAHPKGRPESRTDVAETLASTDAVQKSKKTRQETKKNKNSGGRSV